MTAPGPREHGREDGDSGRGERGEISVFFCGGGFLRKGWNPGPVSLEVLGQTLEELSDIARPPAGRETGRAGELGFRGSSECAASYMAAAGHVS